MAKGVRCSRKCRYLAMQREVQSSKLGSIKARWQNKVRFVRRLRFDRAAQQLYM